MKAILDKNAILLARKFCASVPSLIVIDGEEYLALYAHAPEEEKRLKNHLEYHFRKAVENILQKIPPYSWSDKEFIKAKEKVLTEYSTKDLLKTGGHYA